MREVFITSMIALLAMMAGCAAGPTSPVTQDTEPKAGACKFPFDVEESTASDGVALRIIRADRAASVRDVDFKIEVPGVAAPSSQGSLLNASRDSNSEVHFVDVAPMGTLSVGDELQIMTNRSVIAWLFQAGQAIATNGRCA